jgi:hypothetical protein
MVPLVRSRLDEERAAFCILAAGDSVQPSFAVGGSAKIREEKIIFDSPEHFGGLFNVEVLSVIADIEVAGLLREPTYVSRDVVSIVLFLEQHHHRIDELFDGRRSDATNRFCDAQLRELLVKLRCPLFEVPCPRSGLAGKSRREVFSETPPRVAEYESERCIERAFVPIGDFFGRPRP